MNGTNTSIWRESKMSEVTKVGLLDKIGRYKIFTKSIAGIVIVSTTSTLLYSFHTQTLQDFPPGIKEILMITLGGAIAKLFGDDNTK